MPPTSSTAFLIGGALLGVLVSCYAVLQSLEASRELQDTRKKLKKEQELRKMERAGRTKAERRLRLELKALIKGQTDGGVNLKPVARMQSPFKGRCGTPRQGLLAPNARFVSLHSWNGCMSLSPSSFSPSPPPQRIISPPRPLALHVVLCKVENTYPSLPPLFPPSRHTHRRTHTGVESSSSQGFVARRWTSWAPSLICG